MDRLEVLLLGHGVGDEPRTGLKRGHPLVDEQRADGDAGVEVAGVVEVPHCAGVSAATGRLELVDDLHRPNLGSSGDRSCRETGAKRVDRGELVADLSFHLGLTPLQLLLTLAPHAIPELVALFLPLAAWLIASRRDNWHHLMAATFVTVAIAVPMLLASCFIELFVSPKILLAIL